MASNVIVSFKIKILLEVRQRKVNDGVVEHLHGILLIKGPA